MFPLDIYNTCFEQSFHKRTEYGIYDKTAIDCICSKYPDTITIC